MAPWPQSRQLGIGTLRCTQCLVWAQEHFGAPYAFCPIGTFRCTQCQNCGYAVNLSFNRNSIVELIITGNSLLEYQMEVVLKLVQFLTIYIECPQIMFFIMLADAGAKTLICATVSKCWQLQNATLAFIYFGKIPPLYGRHLTALERDISFHKYMEKSLRCVVVISNARKAILAFIFWKNPSVLFSSFGDLKTRHQLSYIWKNPSLPRRLYGFLSSVLNLSIPNLLDW